MLTKMAKSAFQGRRLGEAFEVWKKLIEGDSLICLGYAGSLSSAGMWPLVTWLMERGYIDVLASTSANITEDLLEQADGTRLYRVDADHVDDQELWDEGYYRFYDHIVSTEKYDEMETRIMGGFIDDLAETWRKPTIPAVRFLYEFGGWLEAKGFRRSILATASRCEVPVFCCALPDGPIGEGYNTAPKADLAPVVDFFKDYRIATDIMDSAMSAGRGTSVIFLGGGVPKDFLQITATSVCSRHGNEAAQPHVAAVQITTDNTVFGGLGGAAVNTECISWGKEAQDGDNVMCFTDVTIALPLICQGLLEHFGPSHRRRQPKPLSLAEVF
jgi:deoxyhypusine synthase